MQVWRGHGRGATTIAEERHFCHVTWPVPCGAAHRGICHASALNGVFLAAEAGASVASRNAYTAVSTRQQMSDCVAEFDRRHVRQTAPTVGVHRLWTTGCGLVAVRLAEQQVVANNYHWSVSMQQSPRACNREPRTELQEMSPGGVVVVSHNLLPPIFRFLEISSAMGW